MTQTSLFVKMVFQPGKRDEGVAALETMLPVVANEPGTLVYSFHRDAGDENAVWIFELYSDGDDEIDPRLLEDVGVEGTEVGRSVQLAPVVCFFGGLFGVILGVIVNLTFLIAVGIAGLVLAMLGFLAAPAVAISRSIRAERNQ